MSIERGVYGEEILDKLYKLNAALSKEKTGTDMDGVEIDSTKKALQVINLKVGTKFRESQLDTYWAAVDLVKPHFPEQEDPVRHVMSIWNSSGVLLTAEPASGLQELSSHVPVVSEHERITSRPPYTKGDTLTWYSKFAPWANLNKIHISEGDGWDVNPDFKPEQISKFGIELYAEDAWEHAEKIVKLTKSIVLLVPRSWNKKYVPEKNSRIITVPKGAYRGYPGIIRAYLHLGDILA